MGPPLFLSCPYGWRAGQPLRYAPGRRCCIQGCLSLRSSLATGGSPGHQGITEMKQAGEDEIDEVLPGVCRTGWGGG